ncbi:hypothetical protein ACFFJY_15380 [Fictibacillus aquaticus]|uniref:Uncharacterized protein n=1 Tax=Fictibacillus aquaticus TaxID=2021314 RepID=A0A235FE49_9BACL|nr:hypothetical protein [Fictibacillus aquaticus]OYD59591.1 hypothetical protein CGZ90_06795 [Fictibacillus aquaticus]
MERYRLFYVYRIKNLSYLHVHGMDMAEKKLFTLLLYAPDSGIDLQAGTSAYPRELLDVLESEKERIEAGNYDILHWEPDLFQEQRLS